VEDRKERDHPEDLGVEREDDIKTDIKLSRKEGQGQWRVL
jgi:hypothetical protein